jgi:archaeosine synthase
MRTGGRLEGLALQGAAEIGPIRLRTPTLLEALGPDETGAGPSVTTDPSRAGTRRIVIGDGIQRLGLEVPVLAPEISPPTSGVFPLGAGVVFLHAPLDVSALRALRGTRPELLILGNARALWNDGEALIATVRAVRTEVGAEPLLWGPRVALPNRLALLAYLGFDLVDTTEGELRAAAGAFLDSALGPRTAPSADGDRGCDCPACAASPPGSLVAHARAAYRRASLELHAALARAALRELVEAHLASEPAMVELLRYADRLLGDLLEARSPVTAAGTHAYVLAEALRRPEMRRFRDRLVERYRPPPSKTVLLLVPCSRTKPYRRSPSHRRLEGAWNGLRGAGRVHVVSVSSPIGVVPRELEDVPPARNYDIPVTGDWSAEEREIVLRGLHHLLTAGGYRHVVPHLDPEEYGFLLDALPPSLRSPATVVDGRPTASASVDRLRATLIRCLDDTPTAPGGPLAIVTEELREVASVQFGRSAAERLFARPVRLEGRPWFQRVTDGHHDLASVREERGLFHLTVAGAVRLGDALARVDVEPSLSLEGDVFAPGVLGADPSVRVGDSVGLFQDGLLTAVGEAALPGPLLGDLRHGLAVRLRHRRHELADRAKTGEIPPRSGR